MLLVSEAAKCALIQSWQFEISISEHNEFIIQEKFIKEKKLEISI